MYLINGHLADSIPVQDRGLNYGDGLFSTIHIENGEPQLWSFHVARLLDSCLRLQIPQPDVDLLYQQLKQLIDQDGLERACGKIILTRGVGGRGYSIQGCETPTSIISLHPYPQMYLQWQDEGIAIGVAEQRLGLSSLLAGMKTLNRLEQVLLKVELEERSLPEAVVLDETGFVREGVTANIFWRSGDDIFTPDLKLSGVCGVMRAFICSVYEQEGNPVRITNSTLDMVKQADEVWLTNALMGCVPVTGIEDVRYKDHREAKRIQALLAAMA